ncbi:hypothetical protein EHS25_006987 [Saitozyma podzolica]|uniref:Rhodopsin domain-containing protein n=1 Tax=Saitozyma podzolica TaxID=1890683 RepID=A0A427XPR7_9TREE|nr:hypothetical protein EHS25_006987 [Saitozyma podzolica]
MESLGNRGPVVFVVTLVLIIFATVFTVLRLMSKWGVTRKATSDDFVAIVAWVFAVGVAVSIMIGTQVGLGAPDSEILPQWYNPLRRCAYAFTILYNPALMTTRTTILILYHNIAAAHPFLRYASLCTMALINIAGIVLTFLNIFQCHPISAAFSEVDGTCIDIVSLYFASAPINALTDLAILLLPLPILTTLRIEFREKVIVVATFMIGGFATLVDVVRIFYLQEPLKEERQIDMSRPITPTKRPANFSYYASFSLMWLSVEVSVGIMCCCVLVLKPLVMRVMPKLLGGHHGHPLPTGTPESHRRSDISSDPRFLNAVQIGVVPGSPLSASSITRMDLPISPRTSDLGRIDSPVSTRPPTLSSIPQQPGNDDEGGTMDFFEMLASETPSEDPHSPLPPFQSTQSRGTSAPRPSTIPSDRRDALQNVSSQMPPQAFFDFVNVKSKVVPRNGDSLAVSTLFFLWGFAYGLLGTLNIEIQTLLGYNPSRTIALHDAYWAAYFFGPLVVGYWVLKREGFKATFMAGLAIYAAGAMSFWPSSVLRSYPGFFISNFIIALGLACLEVAANPFIALAGPGELSEACLNFAQGIQAIGSVVSPMVAQEALFSGVDQEDLFRIQWCYLAVGLFVVFLAVVFFYVPLSEAGDDDLEVMALQRLLHAGLDKDDRAFGVGARHLVLWSGVCVMWIYVGTQEVVSYFWTPLVQHIRPGSDPFWDLAICHGVFAFGRFLAAGLAYIGIPPRIMIGVFIFGEFLTSLLAMLLPQGSAALAMLILVLFFESAIFPTLFAMILRGQGKHTKFASTATTMAISGGAVWPSVAYGIDREHMGNSRYSLLVIAVLCAVCILWPALLSSTRVLRRWVDPKWSKQRVGDGVGTPGPGLAGASAGEAFSCPPRGDA